MGEGVAIVAVVVVAAVQAALTLALVAWGRWVARRHGTKGWRYASKMPLAALALMVMQYATTGILIVQAFGHVAAADPSEKARFLADGISEAMNLGAFFGIPS